jgi:methionine synthase II (cobalamin-independent)
MYDDRSKAEPNRVYDRSCDWARVVGKERRWLAPSCGFGRHPARDVPVLRAKLESMMEAVITRNRIRRFRIHALML